MLSHTHIHTHTCTNLSYISHESYGVAMIRRLLNIIGLFCKRALQQRRYSTNISYMRHETHGVATISRLLKIIRLFCKRALQKRRYSAKDRHKVTMGWLRLVGYLKLYVSFAEYRLFYRALLHKRPII